MFVRLVLALGRVAGAVRADVMERARASGEIRLGYRADAPPFSYTDDDGAPAGLAVALCGRAVEAVRLALGLDALAVVSVAVTAANRFEAGRSAIAGPSLLVIRRFSCQHFPLRS